MRSLFLVAALAFVVSGSAPAQSDPGGRFSSAFSSLLGKPALVGSWSIVESDGDRVVLLAEDFRAREGPDLKVFLSPLRAGEITGENATEGSLNLGLLQSFEGAQRFVIPADTDLSTYRALIVHCEEYSKLWGTSAL